MEKAKVQRCIPEGDSGWTGQSAETDAAGIAAFEQALEGEEAAVVARHPIAGIAGWPRSRTPAPGSTVELALMPGATVQGFARTTDGKPIAGVEVDIGLGEAHPRPPSAFDDLALRCAGGILDPVETNAQGYFRRSDLLHAATSWDARKEGYAWQHGWSVPKGDLQIVMPAVTMVRGRILRKDSGPLPGRGGEIVAQRDTHTSSAHATDDAWSMRLAPGRWKFHYVDVNGKKTAPVTIAVSDEPIALDFDAPE